MLTTGRQLLLASPLSTAEEVHRRLIEVQALALFSSDALSSVAYATEEILLVLVAAGVAALRVSLPIALAIAGLLAIVTTSYYQTIHGYASAGGDYIAAHDNLGVWPGLTAAPALLTDYVLAVTVSITAGVAAITSAFPPLLPFRAGLCLLAIGFIGWANLRVVRESDTLFAISTYGFIFFALIVVGVFRSITGTLSALPAQTPAVAEGGIQALTLFLILRAFPPGSNALSGIEAISNGIPAFRKLEADNAGKILISMAALLVAVFLGITVLAGDQVPTSPIAQLGRPIGLRQRHRAPWLFWLQS